MMTTAPKKKQRKGVGSGVGARSTEMKGNPHEEGAEVSAPRDFPRGSSIKNDVSGQT